MALKYLDIENAHSQKLLGVTIDRKLNFNIMFRIYAKKVIGKISAMARVFPFMLLKKRKLIMKAILMPQFCYCRLVWMNHNRTLHNPINSLQRFQIIISSAFRKRSFCNYSSG